MIITNVTRIGDPMIVLYKNKYYASATYGEKGRDGFFVRESDDLLTWSDPVQCLDAAGSWGENCFWAPEVVYHGGKFVMHFTARQRSSHSLRIGVAVSDSPFGPFSDVYGRPMFDFGYAAIDGSVLICDKGNYLYYSRDCSENIIDGVHTSQLYCIRLNGDLTATVGEPVLITTPEEEYELKSMNPNGNSFIWNEGPCVIGYAGKYLLNYSANCYATNDYCICMATADDPMGPWKKPSYNPVLCSREGMTGAGHNYIFRDKDGGLRTSFHIQTSPEHPGGDRRMVIGRVKLFTDGEGNIREDITD